MVKNYLGTIFDKTGTWIPFGIGAVVSKNKRILKLPLRVRPAPAPRRGSGADVRTGFLATIGLVVLVRLISGRTVRVQKGPVRDAYRIRRRWRAGVGPGAWIGHPLAACRREPSRAYSLDRLRWREQAVVTCESWRIWLRSGGRGIQIRNHRYFLLCSDTKLHPCSRRSPISSFQIGCDGMILAR